MEQKYLIDTNVLIDAQMKNLPDKSLKFLGFKLASKANEDFIGLATVIEIDRNIIDKTIILRKQSSIKLPDPIIAATAIERDLILTTRNISAFKI